ncbi:hypothetical protein BDZ91DRAFT_720233 [Kalaharituber pfeilii]|nr:hypothetical protein BDZ91DRAFT_720233 [Kalaharituber pfeilii]
MPVPPMSVAPASPPTPTAEEKKVPESPKVDEPAPESAQEFPEASTDIQDPTSLTVTQNNQKVSNPASTIAPAPVGTSTLAPKPALAAEPAPERASPRTQNSPKDSLPLYLQAAPQLLAPEALPSTMTVLKQLFSLPMPM